MRLAREQLVCGGYIRESGDGWVLPAVEAALPARDRADPRRELGSQREMPFLATAPPSVRRYMAIVHDDRDQGGRGDTPVSGGRDPSRPRRAASRRA